MKFILMLCLPAVALWGYALNYVVFSYFGEAMFVETAKVVVPRAVVGSFKLDFCCSGEALEKLVDVIHDDLFDRDGVTIEISATSRNW